MTQATESKHRSYSQINQLRTCGEQFRLERIEQKPQRPSCAAVAGTVCHVGTERIDHLMLAGEDNADAIHATALSETLGILDDLIVKQAGLGFPTSEWKRYGKQDVDWFREQGIPHALRAYADWRVSFPDLTIADVPGFGPAIEVPFEHFLGTERIVGYIDRVFTSRSVGGYYPIDLKTGLKPKTNEQLGLYARALSHTYDWHIRWGYYLYGLKTGTAKLTAPINVAYWTDERLAAVYEPAARAIDQGLFIPHPGEACFHCSVSDHCAFVQALV